MSISAHAETSDRYFFGSTMPSFIRLDGMTITPTNVNGGVTNNPRTIFNEDVKYFARVNSSKTGETEFTIQAQTKGVLLVYYARSYDDEPVANEKKDLNIVDKAGYVEIYEKTTTNTFGMKYFVLEAGTYTMTAENATCGVYGFVYMPGNVAAYGVKGKGDANLIGQFCTDYSDLPNLSEKNWRFDGWYKDEAYTEKVNEKDAITEPVVMFIFF